LDGEKEQSAIAVLRIAALAIAIFEGLAKRHPRPAAIALNTWRPGRRYRSPNRARLPCVYGRPRGM
jgi:hypothetical protein